MYIDFIKCYMSHLELPLLERDLCLNHSVFFFFNCYISWVYKLSIVVLPSSPTLIFIIHKSVGGGHSRSYRIAFSCGVNH